jgi:GT2 family glycosyltransferase
VSGEQKHEIDIDAFRAAAFDKRPIDSEITLLIPTLGREMIAETLRSILAGRSWPGQIVIVDQGGVAAIAACLDEIAKLGIRARYIRSRQTGRSRGLNRGLEIIETRFVVVTDDDCLVDEAWLHNIGQHLRRSPERVFTGRIAATGEEPVLGTVLDQKPDVARKPGLLFDRMSGGNLGAAMDVFQHVGLFDEDPSVAYSEDGEWAYRALRCGVEIAFAPDVVVCHRGWRTLDERLQQYGGYARSHAAFFGKYLRRRDVFMALRAILHLARSTRRWVSGMIRADRELAAHGRAYVVNFLPGLIAGMRSGLAPPALEGRYYDQAGAPRK